MPNVTQILDPIEIATRLLTLRRAAKKTQQEFADMMKVLPAKIARAESGKSLPSLDLVARYAGSLNVNLEWIVLGLGKLNSQAIQEHRRQKQEDLSKVRSMFFDAMAQASEAILNDDEALRAMREHYGGVEN